MKYLVLVFFLICPVFAMDPHINFKQAKAHIDAQFANANIEMDPYPHMVVKNILPEELYQQIQYFWPNSSCFDHQCQSNRHLYVTKGCADYHPLTPEQNLFWRVFGEVVIGYIKDYIKTIFIDTLSWKFPNLSASELYDLQQEIRFFDSRQDSLMEHHYGYQIGPHIDQAYLFATALLYCPIDDSHKYQGTTLLLPKDGKYPLPGQYHHGEVSIAKMIPYTPNTLLIMPEHLKQLHGSAKQDDPNYIRKMYGIFVHLAPDLTEKYYGCFPFKYTQEYIYYKWEERFMKFNPYNP